jgi:orotate phosphoribosyltransferase
MEKKQFLIDLLKKEKAILEGHFLLSSGLHSRTYIQCAKLQENPSVLKIFTDLLVEKIKNEIKNQFGELKIDSIVGPATGGIIPAYQLASSFGDEMKTIFAEKTFDGNFEFRRGFEIQKGGNYIIMEDVVTTGGSFKKVSDLIKKLAGNVIYACSLIDRTNGLSKKFDDKFISLLELQIETFDEKNIPEDLANMQAIKPGSSKPSN